MRSIKRRFLNLQEKYPSLSSLINFTRAIKEQKFTKDMIGRWFGKLVEKDDYSTSDKKEILKHLLSVSNFEDNKKTGQINP